jgi:hypothetical protein
MPIVPGGLVATLQPFQNGTLTPILFGNQGASVKVFGSSLELLPPGSYSFIVRRVPLLLSFLGCSW